MKILHDVDRSEFYVEPVNLESGASEDAETAYVRYRIDGAQLDITSTFVPISLRGKGLAEALVREALAFAKHENLRATASCWYADKFIRQ